MLLATEPSLPHLGHALTEIPGFGAHDVSAATVIDVDGHPILCAVSDEGRVVAFVPLQTTGVPDPRGFDLGTVTSGLDDKEIDLEGVTVHEDCVIAIGSLSLKRSRVKPEHDLDKALSRLGKVTKASGGSRTHSDHAYRPRPRIVDGRIEIEFVERIEVRSRLAELPLLAPFAEVPSKDNGLDAEGLALSGGKLYLGLRGPVLRGQALLVETTIDFEAPRLLPIDLQGFGIRAVSACGDGDLWVVSGPTMEHDGPFTLWRVTPLAEPRPRAIRLGELGVEGAGKVETVFAWRGELRILLDGLHGGDPRTVRLASPLHAAGESGGAA